MIAEGEIEPAQVHLHPLRPMLTRAAGTTEPLDLVESRPDRPKAGDCFLFPLPKLFFAGPVSCPLDLDGIKAPDRYLRTYQTIHPPNREIITHLSLQQYL